MGTEAPYLSGVFRFVARLHTLSKRGMRMALAGQPKCRCRKPSGRSWNIC